MIVCIVEYIITIVLSIITSIVAWFLSTKIFRPKIGVSKVIATAEGEIFRIKIQNKSPKRSVYDISIYAMYCYASGNYYSSQINLIPILKNNPPLKNELCNKEKMKPYEMKIELKGPKLKKDNKIQSVVEFFNTKDNGMKNNPYIDVSIIAYDKFSGSVKYAVVQRYHYEDIRFGHKFLDDGLETIEINSETGNLDCCDGNN